jgi:hypothetical protein
MQTLVAFYFCSFFIVIAYIETNILTAVILDAFNIMNEHHDENEERLRIEEEV